MKETFFAKKESVDRKWFVVDATDRPVGKLAAEIARILRGKHKPVYTPHVDTGDFVVVINAEKIVFTGNKWDQKLYRWRTTRPGSMKERTARQMLDKHPEHILEHAVKGMLPKNRLGRQMYKKLKVYVGDQHPHEAQKPEALNL
ncbi:MAG: 50S ribosomal protein L13 [Acidobacteria bacterium]|nr:50S ribosomal protein L13 [Acidobacteriota bacterium]